MTHKGFDDRIVRYEQIHKIEDIDFEKLVFAVDPKVGQKILDGCCGYGEVSKRILTSCSKLGFEPEMYLLDESSVQLERIHTYLPNIPSDHIVQEDIRHTHFQDNTFDTVVIKMGIHELPRDEQTTALKEIFRILKPNGTFVTWELSLDKDDQLIFQDIIREKDRLAGFDKLVANRYFPRLDELHEFLKSAGFTDIKNFHAIWYRPSTWDRREELVSKVQKEILSRKRSLSEDDIKNLVELGEQRARELADYARRRIPDPLKEKMQVRDNSNDIEFRIRKMIITAKK